MKTRLLDSLFVGLLILFVLAGVVGVPFHGDESTIIYMSRDWFLLTQQGNLEALLYNDQVYTDPAALGAAEQELRILNGTLTPFGMGAMAAAAGLDINDLNQQWLWGADYAFNLSSGHVPSPALLFIARLWSAFMTAGSVTLVFTAARRLVSRPGAWVAAFVYATTPAVLLNGRRAIQEGLVLFAIALALLLALRVLEQANWRRWLAFGAACGLGLAAKHNTALITLPLAGGLVLLLLLKKPTLPHAGTLMLRALGAGALALVVFLALNPAWWRIPLAIPAEVVRLRGNLMEIQTSLFGNMTTAGERLRALVEQPFDQPQYFEDPRGWADWLAESIRAYDGSILRGIAWGWIVPLVALFGIIMTREKRSAYWLILFTTVASIVAILVLNPLPWQRYYLPLTPLFALLFGLAVQSLLRGRFA